MGKRTCSIEGCGSPHYARTMCNSHYQAWRKTGRVGEFPRARANFSSFDEAFAARTERQGDCLVWTGPKTGDGYAVAKVRGVQKYMHVFAWEQAHGPVQAGMQVDHTCWNRACCEVAHLRQATSAQNNANRSGPQPGRVHKLPRNVYRSGKTYGVQIKRGGVARWIGTYATVDEASRAAAEAREFFFGDRAGRG